ncbi:hypothetical protein MKD50_22750 [Cupriavidus sp. WGtm5]|uniref:hypothetical protein n=1 Tax=Cupriavidus sp. WGtm5 TaxID=2919926 RepID=UPI0020910C83|nr:hypothetical protein [Cupriavidus sp. WGtm5]MCO4892206.1 hypothetical protein [Cupriavidus sp. WGtm5]
MKDAACNGLPRLVAESLYLWPVDGAHQIRNLASMFHTEHECLVSSQLDSQQKFDLYPVAASYCLISRAVHIARGTHYWIVQRLSRICRTVPWRPDLLPHTGTSAVDPSMAD